MVATTLSDIQGKTGTQQQRFVSISLGTTNPQFTYIPTEAQMLTFLLWCALFLISWPLALAALFLYPIVWLILLPFRIVGIAVHGVLELVSAIILLPVKAIRSIA
jgi:hypothetical protein